MEGDEHWECGCCRLEVGSGVAWFACARHGGACGVEPSPRAMLYPIQSSDFIEITFELLETYDEQSLYRWADDGGRA